MISSMREKRKGAEEGLHLAVNNIMNKIDDKVLTAGKRC